MRTGWLAVFTVAVVFAGCVNPLPAAHEAPDLTTSWRALLGPATDRVVVQVHYTPEHVPYPAALTTLADELGRATGKPVTVQTPIPMPSTGIANHTVADLLAVHARTFTLGAPLLSGDAASHTAWLHVLYLDGARAAGASQSGETIGLHIGSLPAIYYFPKVQHLNVVLPPASWDLLAANDEPVERAILVHEAGHALGLVDCGVPMVRAHDDAQHSCHSASDGSVMTALVGGLQGVLELLQDNQWVPYKFDADDLADLQAAQASFQGGA